MTAHVDQLSYPDGTLPAGVVLRRGTSAVISGGTISATDADPAMLIEFTAAAAQSQDYLVEAVISSLGGGFGFVGVNACMDGDASQYTCEWKRDGEDLTLSRQVNSYVELAQVRVNVGPPTLPIVIGLRVTRLTTGGVRLRGYFGQNGTPGTNAVIDVTDDDPTLRDRRRGGLSQFFFDGAPSSAFTEYRLTDQAAPAASPSSLYMLRPNGTLRPVSRSLAGFA